MKNKFNLFFILCCIAFLGSCKDSNNHLASLETEVEQEIKYQSVGKDISDDNVKSIAELSEELQGLSLGDTIDTKVKGIVKEVCQAKGCWMTLNAKDNEIMVKFKDYGFFVPKDISGSEVIMQGIAFVDEVSVEDQKHYAMDEGKSEEEIAKITNPKKSLAIIAEGVLIAED